LVRVPSRRQELREVGDAEALTARRREQGFELAASVGATHVDDDDVAATQACLVPQRLQVGAQDRAFAGGAECFAE
jgi:hypothetical protein